LIRAGGVLLLSILATGTGYAAHAPRPARERVCDPRTETLSIRKLVRQMKASGGPLAARHARKSRLALTDRPVHFTHALRSSTYDDDDAIQNDAPAATSAIDTVAKPRRFVVAVLEFVQEPFTISSSPRSPRGPPASA